MLHPAFIPTPSRRPGDDRPRLYLPLPPPDYRPPAADTEDVEDRGVWIRPEDEDSEDQIVIRV
jgi:hypothetical protein